MNVSLVALFSLYLLVFLAAILAAWIIFLWQRRRSAARARHFFICAVCGKKIRLEPPLTRVRCPRCGARRERKK
ncbi:MAG: hypothetical protein V1746_07335 [bacterium]